MQKAISESATVNLIAVGSADNKFVDIEDVLPHSQVAKKNIDSKTEKTSQETLKDIKIEESVDVAVKSQEETEEKRFKEEKKDSDHSVPSGSAGDKKLDEKIESGKEEIRKRKSVDKSDDSKNIEKSKQGIEKQKSEELSIKFEDKDNIKVDPENQPAAVTDDNNESEELSLEVKAELIEEGQSKVDSPNPKTNLLDCNPSTSEEIGVPSSSTSPTHLHSEAMLVSDPVPQDASLPKTFGTGDDSSLLAPESSSIIHSAVSSTTGPSEVLMVDEETRMSADTSSRAQTPAKQLIPMDTVEESQSSVQSTATTESGKASSSRPSKAPRLEVQEPEGSIISPDQLAEYYWNGNGPYMLQEQVAHFLGIKSFKRKYPGIKRRMLEMQERDFIRESGLVSEHMCDLGLTAVNSADILDIMYSDFQEKYEEYCKHQRDRQTKELINKQRALSLAASQEKNKADLTANARQSAAQWNANFNKTRREQRRACMDLQTYTVHFPKGRMKQFSKVSPGNYPVSLVPGQFTDYYKEFTPTEINNLPLNTMCYEPIDYIRPEESSDSGSDGSDSDSDSSSSSSGSDSSSSSGLDDCKLCKHSPKKIITPPVTK